MRNAGCSVSHARAGGGFLLTPYVIHRLVRLAPSGGSGGDGRAGKEPKERGPEGEMLRGVGSASPARGHSLCWGVPAQTQHPQDGSVGSGRLGMDLGIIYTRSAAGSSGDECFEPSNAATRLTTPPH